MAKEKPKPKRKVRTPTGAILTKFLRILSQDIETVNEDGDLVTKAQALADMVWKYALGWTEQDPDDPEKTLKHKPMWQAVQLLYDRIEGKVQPAAPEETGKTLPEKVAELSKSRINAAAEATQPEPNTESEEKSE